MAMRAEVKFRPDLLPLLSLLLVILLHPLLDHGDVQRLILGGLVCYTGYIVHDSVVADKRMGVAVCVARGRHFDLRSGRQVFAPPGICRKQIGTIGRVLRPHCDWPLLLSQEC